MGMIDQLRRLLSESGYSANEIGRRTGGSPSQVSRYLRGERTLSMPVIEKLCAGLGFQLVREEDGRLLPALRETTDSDILRERLEQALAEIQRYRRREREALGLAHRMVSLLSTGGADRGG